MLHYYSKGFETFRTQKFRVNKKKWNFFIRLSFLKIHCRSFSDGLCAHVAALYIDYSCFYFSVQREETCKVTFKCKKKPLHTKCAAMKTFLKILALHSMQNEILVFCYTQPKKKNFHFLGEWSEKLPRIVHAHPNLSCTVDCGGVKSVRTNQNLIRVKKNLVQVCTYFLCTVLCSFQIIFVFFSLESFSLAKNFCWQYYYSNQEYQEKYSTFLFLCTFRILCIGLRCFCC